MPAFGVYPVADVMLAGEEVSSTYEGRHVTLLESELIHKAGNVGGFVNKGDAVVFGTTGKHAVGVSFKTATAATDLIALDTEGIWALDVFAQDDNGASAVAGGDLLFINTTTAVISKITNIATQIPFGYALGIITGGLTEVIAVKVHFDPTVDSHLAMFNTTISGGYGKSMRATLAGGASEGLSGYHEGHITAALTGHTYNFGSWINVDAISLLAAGHIVTPFEGGIYADTVQAAARVVFVGQGQAILAGPPASLHAWRLNVAQVAGNITALIAAANPESVGYVTSGATASTKVGSIPIADIVSKGIVWIRCYDSAV